MVRITRHARQQKRHRCIEQSFGLCGRGRGRGWDVWGNSTETCIILYKKRITSPGSIQDAWGWCTGTTWRGGTGRDVEAGLQDGEHAYARG